MLIDVLWASLSVVSRAMFMSCVAGVCQAWCWPASVCFVTRLIAPGRFQSDVKIHVFNAEVNSRKLYGGCESGSTSQ